MDKALVDLPSDLWGQATATVCGVYHGGHVIVCCQEYDGKIFRDVWVELKFGMVRDDGPVGMGR